MRLSPQNLVIFFRTRRRFLLVCMVLITAGVFVFAQGARAADIEVYIARAVTWVIELLIRGFGSLTLLMADFLVWIAQYNDFVTSKPVVTGWVLVRDVTNMFFLLILLIIAFGTIFGYEQYHYSKLLPRLLVVVILVNFSRTIAGLFIDFGQVIMLTFVNGFKEAAGGNFVEALQIKNLLDIDPSAKGEDLSDLTGIVIGYLLALVMTIVTFIVILSFCLILVFRIIWLWMLVILSPLAFAMSAWPSAKAKGKYSEWWDKFTNYVVVGPILAFFLWLSLLTLGGGNVVEEMGMKTTFTGPGGEEEKRIVAATTKAGGWESVSSYLIGIAMLIGSLIITQQMGVTAGGAGMKMVDWSRRKATRAATKAGKAVGMAGLKKIDEKGKFRERAYGALAKVGGASYLRRLPGMSGLQNIGVKGRKKIREGYEKKYAEASAAMTTEERMKAKNVGSDYRRRALTRDAVNNPFAYYDKKTGKWNKEEASKDLQNLQGWAEKDPALWGDIIKFKSANPQLIDDGVLGEGEQKKAVEALSPTAASKLQANQLTNEVLGYMNEPQKERIRKFGSAASKERLEEWEKEQPKVQKEKPDVLPPEELRRRLTDKEDPNYMTDEDLGNIPTENQTPEVLAEIKAAGRIEPMVVSGTLNIENVELDAGIASQIAAKGTESLKERTREKKGEEYIAGLEASIGETPKEDHTQKRAEMLRAGAGVERAYGKVNKKGLFVDQDGKVKRKATQEFQRGMEESPDLALGIDPGSLRGEILNQTIDTLGKKGPQAFRELQARAGADPAKLASLRGLTQKTIERGEEKGASPEVQATAAELKNMPVFRGMLSEDSMADLERQLRAKVAKLKTEISALEREGKGRGREAGEKNQQLRRTQSQIKNVESESRERFGTVSRGSRDDLSRELEQKIKALDQEMERLASEGKKGWETRAKARGAERAGAQSQLDDIKKVDELEAQIGRLSGQLEVTAKMEEGTKGKEKAIGELGKRRGKAQTELKELNRKIMERLKAEAEAEAPEEGKKGGEKKKGK